MKIHLRAYATNSTHTRFHVFVNSKNVGDLTMSPDEACNFHQIVQMGCQPPVDTFLSDGEWFVEPRDEETHDATQADS